MSESGGDDSWRDSGPVPSAGRGRVTRREVVRRSGVPCPRRPGLPSRSTTVRATPRPSLPARGTTRVETLLFDVSESSRHPTVSLRRRTGSWRGGVRGVVCVRTTLGLSDSCGPSQPSMVDVWGSGWSREWSLRRVTVGRTARGTPGPSPRRSRVRTGPCRITSAHADPVCRRGPRRPAAPIPMSRGGGPGPHSGP